MPKKLRPLGDDWPLKLRTLKVKVGEASLVMDMLLCMCVFVCVCVCVCSSSALQEREHCKYFSLHNCWERWCLVLKPCISCWSHIIPWIWSDNLHITHKYKVSCHTSFTLSSVFTSSCGKCGSTVWMRIEPASDHCIYILPSNLLYPWKKWPIQWSLWLI
jgi:hypothetical protein